MPTPQIKLFQADIMSNVKPLDPMANEASQTSLEQQMNQFLSTIQTKDLISVHAETIMMGLYGAKISSFGYIVYNT